MQLKVVLVQELTNFTVATIIVKIVNTKINSLTSILCQLGLSDDPIVNCEYLHKYKLQLHPPQKCTLQTFPFVSLEKNSDRLKYTIRNVKRFEL
jgi:hypothetical protein